VILEGMALLRLAGEVRDVRTQCTGRSGLIPFSSRLQGRQLPSVQGTVASTMSHGSWEGFLPRKSGLVVILDAAKDDSWYIADQLGRMQDNGQTPEYCILLRALTGRATWLFQKSGMPRDRVILIDPDAQWLEDTRVIWTPAVIALKEGVICGVGQFYNWFRLREFLNDATRHSVIGGDPGQLPTTPSVP
jgi:hypothetical protein